MTESPKAWMLNWRLVSLYDGELLSLAGMRAAKWVGGAIVLFSALTMVALRADHGGRSIDQAALKGVAWLSWSVGGLALFSAAPRWFEFQKSVTDLATQKGFDKRFLGVAPALALARRLWLLIGAPAVLLALLAVALTSDPRLIPSRVALVPALGGYGLLLASVLAGLTRWSAALSPRFARSWLLLLVVGPHVSRALWPSTPSIVTVFAWLLDTFAHWGLTA